MNADRFPMTLGLQQSKLIISVFKGLDNMTKFTISDDAMNDFLKHRFDDCLIDEDENDDDVETLDEIERIEYERNVLSLERG